MRRRMSPGTRSGRATIIAAHRHREGATLPILHALQDAFGYVPEAAMPMVAEALNLSRAEVHGVVTFYHDFRHEPAGRHVLKLCRAEACQAAGGDALAARAEAKLGVKMGETTRRRPRDARGRLLPRTLRHGAFRACSTDVLSAGSMSGGSTRLWRRRSDDARASSFRATPARWRRRRRGGARSAGRAHARSRRRDRAHRLARALLAGADGRGRNGCRAASPMGRSSRRCRGPARRRDARRRAASAPPRARRGDSLAQAPDPAHLRALRHRRSALARRLSRAWRLQGPGTRACARRRRRPSKRWCIPACAGAAAQASRPASSGAPSRRPRRSRNTSSATPTKATAAPSPTA